LGGGAQPRRKCQKQKARNMKTSKKRESATGRKSPFGCSKKKRRRNGGVAISPWMPRREVKSGVELDRKKAKKVTTKKKRNRCKT